MSLPLATTTGLLERADRAYKMGQFEEALDHAAQAEAEASKERDRGIASRMKGFEESLFRARMDGTDTRSAERLFERAREFFRAKKYRQAIAAAEQSEEEAERVGLQQGMSKQAVESVERKLRAIGKGPLAVNSLVSDSRRMYNDGDYVKALDTAIRASDAIDDLRILLAGVRGQRRRRQEIRIRFPGRRGALAASERADPPRRVRRGHGRGQQRLGTGRIREGDREALHRLDVQGRDDDPERPEVRHRHEGRRREARPGNAAAKGRSPGGDQGGGGSVPSRLGSHGGVRAEHESLRRRRPGPIERMGGRDAHGRERRQGARERRPGAHPR